MRLGEEEEKIGRNKDQPSAKKSETDSSRYKLLVYFALNPTQPV